MCASPATAIGKSAFGLGLYLLWQTVRARRTAFYVSHMEQYGYIFHQSGRMEAFVASDLRHAASGVMQAPDTVVIFDGDGDCATAGFGQPPFVAATTVLVTSPDRTRYKGFAKTGAL